jgi:hypothetical protein
MDEQITMTDEQRKVAAVLADARAEALKERPLAAAAINDVIERLADMYEEDDPSFDRSQFYAAANYRGISDGSTGRSLLP